ncbi:hypothetical protein [Comamonas thiooxydans]|uniref:hypothetical protein n=1 Tax=Comamonas thiooxydans TaxID=363952 RepID=UPI0010407177|nr:hypothetical protein [Comamonas thiooxydans]
MEEQNPVSDDSSEAVTVDEYYGWAASFDNLPLELQYIVLSRSGGRIVEGGSPRLLQAHRLLLQSIKQQCEPVSLAQQIKEANFSVFTRNKAVYVIGALATLFCLCVGVYKLSKVVSNVVF